jgi:hypothetical protein
MRKYKGKRYRSPAELQNRKRRSAIHAKQRKVFTQGDRGHVKSFEFLDRGGNAGRLRRTMKVESIQLRLRDGTLHMKGKVTMHGASKKAYANVNANNPVLPVFYQMDGFPTVSKPKNNERSEHIFTICGKEYTISDLNTLISAGQIEAEEVACILQSIKESLANHLVKFDNTPGLMSLDKWPAWKVNEVMDEVHSIEKRFA